GAGVEVGAVDLLDRFRLGEREQIVVALEVAGPVREALAAEVGLAEALALDERAHRAVDDEETVAEVGGERRRGVGAKVGHDSQVWQVQRYAARVSTWSDARSGGAQDADGVAGCRVEGWWDGRG